MQGPLEALTVALHERVVEGVGELARESELCVPGRLTLAERTGMAEAGLWWMSVKVGLWRKRRAPPHALTGVYYFEVCYASHPCTCLPIRFRRCRA
jgi:hypothetical protein